MTITCTLFKNILYFLSRKKKSKSLKVITSTDFNRSISVPAEKTEGIVMSEKINSNGAVISYPVLVSQSDDG